jgi:hypothetical protein
MYTLTYNMDEIIVAADGAVPREDAVLVDGVLVPVVDHGELQLKGVCNHDGALGASLVRRHHDAVSPAMHVLLDPRAEDRLHLVRTRDIRYRGGKIQFNNSSRERRV